MKRALAALSLLVIAALLAGCGLDFNFAATKGSGKVVSESRSVSGFEAVSLSGVGELTITQGDSESLTVEAEDNILPHIITEVKDGTLIIRFDTVRWTDSFQPTKSIKFTLTVKDLAQLDISGAGSTDVGDLKTESLSVDISGAGSLKIKNLEADDLQVNLSGAGSFDLAGKAARQTVTIDGAGSYNAGDLECQEASVTISGAGSATVWATETLDAELNGVGSIRYYGEPEVTESVSGLGTVVSLGAK
jgi:hypothetical protein